MYESFLIVFRESLEVALIVGIILAYLRRTNNTKSNGAVYIGIVAGVMASALLAYLFTAFLGEFEGVAEEVFEGVIMLSAAVLISSMIYWFLKQSSVRKKIESSIDAYSEKWSTAGLFLIVFLSVLREGVETVLFMSAIFLKSSASVGLALSGFLGMGAALFLGYLIFVVGRRVCLRHFFLGSNVLLILFAAGLMAHGVHELQEAGVVPTINEHLYDMNHLIDENGVVGSLMKALFGYNGNPSLIEVATYLGYLMVAATGYRSVQRKKLVLAES